MRQSSQFTVWMGRRENEAGKGNVLGQKYLVLVLVHKVLKINKAEQLAQVLVGEDRVKLGRGQRIGDLEIQVAVSSREKYNQESRHTWSRMLPTALYGF